VTKLNKNMATYQEIRRQIESLTLDEQLRLMEELATIVRHRTPPKPKRSIMELEGLGKDIWQGINAQEYVDRERLTWNG
jgi:DNA-binding HxlR family transcriptional regulator